MTKHLFLFLILTFTSLPLLAQDYQVEIREDFSAYMDHVIAQDYDKVLNATYERFFELLPRDKMKQMMAATFNNPDVEYEITGSEVHEIGTPRHIGDEFFSILTYTSVIRMKFLAGNANETQEEFEQRMKMTRLSLEEVFGSDNVYYEAETGYYRLTSLKKVCAVSPNGQTDWKFIVLEKEMLETLRRILPDQIITEVREG